MTRASPDFSKVRFKPYPSSILEPAGHDEWDNLGVLVRVSLAVLCLPQRKLEDIASENFGAHVEALKAATSAYRKVSALAELLASAQARLVVTAGRSAVKMTPSELEEASRVAREAIKDMGHRHGRTKPKRRRRA